MIESLCRLGICKFITQWCYGVIFYTIHFPGVVNLPRKGAGSGKKPWTVPFFQAHTDQKSAPATQKHKENTPQESAFHLKSTATFLNSLQKGKKCSQQTDVAD